MPASPFAPARLLHDQRLQPKWRLLWLVMALVVGAGALTPGSMAPTLSPSDKFDHALAFAALAGAGMLSWPPGWRPALLVGLAMVGYGGFIELAQLLVPGRSSDGGDLLADAVGVVIGLSAVFALRRIWRPLQG